MAAPTEYLARLADRIDEGSYFFILAPPKSGKTTVVNLLTDKINGWDGFRAFSTSLKHVGRDRGSAGAELMILSQLFFDFKAGFPDLDETRVTRVEDRVCFDPTYTLGALLSDLAELAGGYLVVFFDDIDHVSGAANNLLFDALIEGHARALGSPGSAPPFPHSVVMVGEHDLDPGNVDPRSPGWLADVYFASPLFKTVFCLGGLGRGGLARLLADYSLEHPAAFEDGAVEKIWEWGSGHLWLTNVLASAALESSAAAGAGAGAGKKDKVSVSAGAVVKAARDLVEKKTCPIPFLWADLREKRTARVVGGFLRGKRPSYYEHEGNRFYFRDPGLFDIGDEHMRFSDKITQGVALSLLSAPYFKRLPDARDRGPLVGRGGIRMTELVAAFHRTILKNRRALAPPDRAYASCAPLLAFLAFADKAFRLVGQPVARELDFELGSNIATYFLGDKPHPLEFVMGLPKIPTGRNESSAHFDRLFKFMKERGARLGWKIVCRHSFSRPPAPKIIKTSVARGGMVVEVLMF
jgi:hypothetical protein